jgi:Flp pilus assembly protein TadG
MLLLRFIRTSRAHVVPILAFLRRFRRHEQGSIAIVFALAIIPVFVAFGVALDYSFANMARTKLNIAADAAILSAVNSQSMSLTAAAAQTTSQQIFDGQAVVNGVTVTNRSVNVQDVGSVRTASISYTATVPTTLMRLMGTNSMTIGGSAAASANFPIYIDFYLLLDNTPSMGVAATPADVTTMVNNTPDKCAFACHDTADPNNYYKLAKQLGVTMRIDVVRSATQQLMDTATTTRTYSNQFRMATYTFGASATTAGLTTITSLTSNLSTAKTDAAAIDLMMVSGQNQNNDQDTNFDSIFPAMNNAITNPGTGLSSASPQKVLFFVSDGVADEPNPGSCSQPTTGGRCQEPIDVSLCTTIKQRGIKIAVLYTTYLALPTNAWYMSWIDPFNSGPYGPSVNSQIAANMQSCASSGLYFEVSPTQGISDAMNALFRKVLAQAHLSQ